MYRALYVLKQIKIQPTNQTKIQQNDKNIKNI